MYRNFLTIPLLTHKMTRQVLMGTVDGGFQAVTNISRNIKEITGSIKFSENLQP